jgi:hypothetical protein
MKKPPLRARVPKVLTFSIIFACFGSVATIILLAVTVGFSSPDTLGNYKVDGCTIASCLFTKTDKSVPELSLSPIGYARLTGYYTSVIRPGFFEGEKVTCDAFTITDGTKELIDSFSVYGAGWENVEKKIMLVGLSGTLHPTLEGVVKKSTVNKPVELLVLRTIYGSHDNPCGTPVSAIGISPT